MKFIEHYYVGEDYEETFFMEENGDVFYRCYIYHDRPSTLVFDMFSVSERARKIGLGTEVISNVLPTFAKEYGGIKCISLWVKKKTWLVDWYKEHGFKYLKGYPQEDAIWLRKKI